MERKLISTLRFSERVKDYLKYRPGYPKEIVDYLRSEANLKKTFVIADVGSGTGNFTELFLKNGNVVYAIEPNEKMRKVAEKRFKKFPNFISIDGTAEDTKLPDNSVHFVVSAQAFHWFDRKKFKKECKRILKKGGYVILVWNKRKTQSSEFMKEYEKFVRKYSKDYEKVHHKKITEKIIKEFYGDNFKKALFPNYQDLDYEGLVGRYFSASYAPKRKEALPELYTALRTLFNKYNIKGKVRFNLQVELYLGQFN